MTTWSYNVLMVDDARLDRWVSVGYAEQVKPRAGTEGVLTILHRCKKC